MSGSSRSRWPATSATHPTPTWRCTGTRCSWAWLGGPTCRTVSVAGRPWGVELVLEVDDVHAERDRVLDAGWPLAEDLTIRPWGLTDFRLLDPVGYYWRVTGRVPPT